MTAMKQSGASALLAGGDVGGTRSFGNLKIKGRVIDTGARTIAIANVATISVAKEDRGRQRLALLFLGSLLLLYASQTLQTDTKIYASIVGCVFILAVITLREKAMLAIGTCDGARSLFVSTDVEGLKQIKDFLTDKIDRGDMAAGKVFLIDQSKVEQKIDKVVMGNDHSVTADTLVAGENNQTVVGSQNVQFGGPGSIATQTLTHIDYAPYLAQVSDWRAFYEQRSDTQDVAAKLGEVERLMRSGTPDSGSRNRLLALAKELGQIMQTFQPAVQLFSELVKLLT